MKELPAIHKRQSAYLVLKYAFRDAFSVFQNASMQTSRLAQP
jgi:hypothetical protein